MGDIDVSNVEQVEMTTFESEPTGGQFIISRGVGNKADRVSRGGRHHGTTGPRWDYSGGRRYVPTRNALRS